MITGQKQTFIEDLEIQIIDNIKKKFNIISEECKIIHPKEMYNYFKSYWSGHALMNYGYLEQNMKFEFPKNKIMKNKLDVNFITCKLYTSSILYLEKRKANLLR